jgi:hypothetical protein
MLQGRGPEGTYYFDVFSQLISPLPTPLKNQLPPSGTKVAIQPQVFASHGYNICSVLPGETLSYTERPHISFPTRYVADDTLITQRTLDLYGFTGDTVTDLQTVIESDANRPVGKSGLARMYPPSYVTCTFYYEGDFSAENAADAVVERMAESTAEERLELSDLLDSLRDLGAGYVTSGRMFVMQMDHRRIWSYEATRGAVKIHRLSRPLPLAITLVKLKAREIGEVVDETDPANQEQVFVYRYGGFNAD